MFADAIRSTNPAAPEQHEQCRANVGDQRFPQAVDSHLSVRVAEAFMRFVISAGSAQTIQPEPGRDRFSGEPCEEQQVARTPLNLQRGDGRVSEDSRNPDVGTWPENRSWPA